MSAVTTAILSPSSYPCERKWHLGVLEGVSRLIGSYKSGIRVFADGGHHWTNDFETDAVPMYNAYFQRFDHGRALSDTGVRGSQIISTIQCYKDRLPELRQSEFYCDFLQPSGFFDGITLSTRRHDHHKGTSLYVWHEHELTELARSRAIAILRLLAPAFRSGMGAAVRLRCGNDSFYSVVDGLTEGCALFTPSGVLLHQNPALSALYAASLEREALRDAMMGVVANMREMCLWGRGGAADPRATSADTHGASGRYRVSGCVLERSPVGNAPAILVTVAFSPHAASLPQPGQLRKRFGLTRRESEVALLLASRRTNQEIAAALGMSAHTARHHTENVMRKTDARSRTEIATMFGRSSSELS